MSALYRQNIEISHEEAPIVIEYDESTFSESLKKASDLRASGKAVALKNVKKRG